MRPTPRALCALAATAALCGPCLAAASPPIRTRLHSDFPAPPLLLELAEAISAHNSSAYFPFLLHLAHNREILADSDASAYRTALNWISSSSLLEPFAQGLVQLELSTHLHAPMVVAQYQMYTATVVPDLVQARGEDQFDRTCEVWAQFKDRQACDVGALEKMLEVETFYGDTYVEQASVEPEVLDFDHVYPAVGGSGGRSSSSRVVALYADPRAEGFVAMHEYLAALAENSEITYVLRYRPWAPDGEAATGRSAPAPALALVGYGVELALKSTEYKVIDDRELSYKQPKHVSEAASASEKTPVDPRAAGNGTYGGGEFVIFKSEEEEEGPVVKGLSEKQVADLGIQATQMLLSAPHARKLPMLKQLAQDLPRYAHLLSAVPLNTTLASKLRSNPPTSHGPRVLINGLELDAQDATPFSLLEHLRRENAVISSLEHLGLKQHQAVDLLLAADAQAADPEDSSRLVFDVRDQSNTPGVILWLNDLEKDKRYAAWPADLQNLRRMVAPGMVQRLRRNLVQVLFALDLSEPDSWVLVLEELMANVEHGLPMQFGIAPLVDYAATDARGAEENTMAKLVLYLRHAFRRKEWQAVVKSALVTHYRGMNGGAGAAATFTESMREVYEAYIKTHSTKDGRSPLTWGQIANVKLSGDSAQDSDDLAWLAQRWGDTLAYCRRLDLSASSPGLVFVNGEQFSMGSNYQQHVFGAFQRHTWDLAQMLRAGEISAQDDVQEIVYGRGALPERSTLIYVSDEHPLRILPLGTAAATAWMGESVRYLSGKTEAEPVVSMWVVGDLGDGRVRRVAAEALRAMGMDGRIRVALVHVAQDAATQGTGKDENEEEEDEREGYDVDAPQVVHQLVASGADAKAVLAYLLGDTDSAATQLGQETAELLQPLGEHVDAAESRFAANLAQLLSLAAVPSHTDSCHIVVNGRILPEITSDTAVSRDTLVQLAELELRERIMPVRDAIAGVLPDIPAGAMPDWVLRVSAIVEHGRTMFAPRSVLHRGGGKTQTRQKLGDLDVRGLVGPVWIDGSELSPNRIHIQAVLDPLSEAAQKWAAMFQTLLYRPDYSVELWLAPQPKLTELPVKRFYRYLWPSQLEFDSAERVVQPEVVFHNVPADPLLTLGMDVPSAWLVTATDSVHDLDNIRLSSVKDQEAGIEATYRLANILVEGHLVDTNSRAPARGLEVQLGTAHEPAMTDTIVMANLGYLQLKANPGVWRFAIRPGRSADIYKMDSIGETRWDYQAAKAIGKDEEDRRPVLVTSFGGTTIFPLVSKRAGRENDDVLDDGADEASGLSAKKKKQKEEAAAGGLWGKLRGSLGGGTTDVGAAKHATPHFDVFAVASGHLYERLLSIMITSVLNSTQSHVKFWLIENFLSPSFKSFVPHMAEEFGFDYEFVTYKWPHWLHHETEKQRTIWGYKILFLDVLFPLSLDRVIFVDADQIVRADLQELADMDLEGAPYGYVPFCNDREDIDGYRFWKHGWWKDHLRGKPYHISALYVVDLRRFRQLAAGDRLRGQYQMLSRDANSLANLDQDLPNNMQHLVPIFSLPQDWLWCETWCADEALARAKTIDLCNNPMTKEPKLVRARRLLPEWEVYDRKVADFTRVLAQRGKHEGAQIADAEAVNIDQQPETTDAHTDTEEDTHAAEHNKHDEL
ncbi:killer toxin resistant protein [Coemansia interrupta]|uniref:Killer toxin resistant protein n=1 Tax=Coemansia interrupta TaxID=1126814 RepID=A0A9W8HEK5_9FUNG|nr:killer toxin resistant protein [Coemansia interrupta]